MQARIKKRGLEDNCCQDRIRKNKIDRTDQGQSSGAKDGGLP